MGKPLGSRDSSCDRCEAAGTAAQSGPGAGWRAPAVRDDVDAPRQPRAPRTLGDHAPFYGHASCAVATPRCRRRSRPLRVGFAPLR